MNKIIPFNTEYIRPSRTIEIFTFFRFEKSRQIYIYNYEGKHFRVFDSVVGLVQFFEVGKEPSASFDSESDLDEYLDSLSIGDG
ncbi:hypothetical protein [Mongoliitalea daihaiensis]|uniref:hypothetical protein n=1 Tax=Mongoliitalea daihaiensis TaxID=2782006 RepID=UPI001F2B53E3|nr:hypothetical protein [Mongoliitalea daihaiensis]UJP66704.1 hypothetical protein IPZ59_09010 [Mongoliitalea daihaiensis]